jgi:hypothetical protein
LLYIVWPYLWLVRLGLFGLFGGWTLYLAGSGILKLRGTYLEQEKNRRIVPPIDGRLPAWIDSLGNVRLLEEIDRQEAPRVQVMEIPPLPPLPPKRPRAPEWSVAKRDFVPGEIVIGYGVNGPIRLPITEVLSIALVGKSGTGKSNTIRFLLGQYDVQGAGHSIWDAHGDLSNDLGGLTEIEDIMADAERVDAIYKERQAQYKAGERSFPPYVVVIDEWKEVHRSLKKIKPTISNLISGGRKYNVHLIISSQFFKAEMFDQGVGDLDSIRTRYLHWTDTRQADYARVTDEEVKEMLADVALYGTKGYAIISNPSVETQVLSISRTESSDIRR